MTEKYVKLKYLCEVKSGDFPQNELISKEASYPLIGGGKIISRYPLSNALAQSITVGRVGTIGDVRILENESFITDNGFIITANKSIYPRWLYYSLKTINWTHLSSGTAQPLITSTAIKNIKIKYCEPSEQKKIADELDRELTEIDEFIAELEKTQELLNEKYEQEINNLYWSQTDNVIPLKRFIKFVDQGSSPNADSTPAEANEIGILKSGCTAGGEFNITANKKIIPGTPLKESTFIKKGDLLVTRASGSKEIVGSAAIVGELDRRLALSDKIYRLHFEYFEISRYICNVMATKKFREQVELEISGAGGLAKNISLSSLLSIKIPFPRNIHELNKKTQNTKINHKLNLKDLEITIYTIREKKDSILSTTFGKQIIL